MLSRGLALVAFTVFPDFILLFKFHNGIRTWPITSVILDIAVKPRVNNLLLHSRGILDRYNVVR